MLRRLPGFALAWLLVASSAAMAARAPRAAGATPARTHAVAANFELQPVAEGVYAVVRKDPPGLMCDANSLVIVNVRDVIVVDAPESSREVIAALRALTRKPVSVVIHTHAHDDHVTGDQAYRDAWPDVELVAHEAVREYLPTRGLEVLAVGAGHTAGDLVVWLPRERVLASGDLVVAPVPLVGADQSHIATWAPALDSLRALKPAVIVPGHGPVMHDDTHLALEAELFRSIQRQVAAAVARGETLEQVRKSVDLADLRARFVGTSRVRALLFAQYVAGPAVAAAYREAGAAR
jgi:glyoxylase-like metal-dependent hydrolase (beta-lactamase superfamily II)